MAGRRALRPRRRSTPTRIPPPDGFAEATLEPAAARWDGELGEYVLDQDDVRSRADAVTFARSAFQHACIVCDWDPALPASAEGQPPPVN